MFSSLSKRSHILTIQKLSCFICSFGSLTIQKEFLFPPVLNGIGSLIVYLVETWLSCYIKTDNSSNGITPNKPSISSTVWRRRLPNFLLTGFFVCSTHYQQAKILLLFSTERELILSWKSIECVQIGHSQL